MGDDSAHWGGGPYEKEALAARKSCGATGGVVLLVKGGNRGDGFEVLLDQDGLRALPRVLRTLADEIDRAARTGGSNG